MNKKVPFHDKLRYKFDNTLSQGTISIIKWLAVLSAIMVLIFGVIYIVSGVYFNEEHKHSFFEASWQALMRAFDPGMLGSDTAWNARLIGAVVTIGGIFLISTLIGVLTSGLGEKIEEMRKGRSTVLETNHTLILGWTPKIFHILSELILANENKKNARIVILAAKDKVEMEDEIRQHITHFITTKIICRTGNPMDLNDLAIVSPNTAKSIIVLSPPEDKADIFVIKTVLALTYNPDRKPEKYHIVAELKDKNNLEAAEVAGRNEAIYILTSDFTARIAAQTCRQSGLSIIYSQLLCIEGDEIYIQKESSLIGKTFKQATFAYQKSTVIGICFADGSAQVNPPQDYVLKTGDEPVVISQDDDTIILSGVSNFDITQNVLIKEIPQELPHKERNLILGWNQRGSTLIRELDSYVEQGSEILVVSEFDKPERIQAEIETLNLKQEVKIERASTSSKSVLEKLNIPSFDNVILMSYPLEDIQESDAKTLITLLHIRDIIDKSGKKMNIVSEMCDHKNRKLAEATKADDFIISDDLISQMLTQLSEDVRLKKVLDDLFDANGSEIYLKKAENYIKLLMPVNFYTILESASQKNETAVGYRIGKYAQLSEHNYGIVMNPKKDEEIVFEQGDKIIVIAEN